VFDPDKYGECWVTEFDGEDAGMETHVAEGDGLMTPAVDPDRASEEVISAFHVRLLYHDSRFGFDEWRQIAGVEHESRLHFDGRNVFSDGIVLQFYKYGQLRHEQRYTSPQALDGKMADEALMIAETTVKRNLPVILEKSDV
jgi:hypothetical protein